MSKVIRPQVRQWNVAQSSKLLENWSMSGRPPDIDIRYGLKPIRARARLESQNNDHVKGFLNMVICNVVGKNGVIMQSKAKMASGKADKKLQTLVEDYWADFGKRGMIDVTGTQSWNMIQKTSIRTIARDGECFYRIAYGFPNKYGFALQEIDPECVDIDLNIAASKGKNEIRMGVELDGWRRPVAYYLTDEPAITSGGYGFRRNHTRVSADEIIHCFLPEWTWQTRGVPWAAASLARLHVLSSYEDAEVAAASISARKLGFYKRSPEAPPLEDDSGQPIIDDVGIGEFETLPPYYDFVGWDPQHPNAAYGDFVKSCLRSVATGLGVSYNMLANDLEGVNYSSLRQGALFERDMWMTMQDWFVESFCQIVFDRWINYQIDVNGVFNNIPPKKFQELRRSSWQPRRWSWVDPLKDQQANAQAIAMRTKSISAVIREQGLDPADVWEELANDEAMLENLGLSVTNKQNSNKSNAGANDAGN